MGRKKAAGTADKQEQRPFCFFCDRTFEDELVLIQHQRAKHFRCPECDDGAIRGKCESVQGLVVHTLKVHGKGLSRVPNALQGRDNPELNVYGLDGIPEEVMRSKGFGELANERNVAPAKSKPPTPGGSLPLPPGMPSMEEFFGKGAMPQGGGQPQPQTGGLPLPSQAGGLPTTSLPPIPGLPPPGSILPPLPGLPPPGASLPGLPGLPPPGAVLPGLPGLPPPGYPGLPNTLSNQAVSLNQPPALTNGAAPGSFDTLQALASAPPACSFAAATGPAAAGIPPMPGMIMPSDMSNLLAGSAGGISTAPLTSNGGAASALDAQGPVVRSLKRPREDEDEMRDSDEEDESVEERRARVQRYRTPR